MKTLILAVLFSVFLYGCENPLTTETILIYSFDSLSAKNGINRYDKPMQGFTKIVVSFEYSASENSNSKLFINMKNLFGQDINDTINANIVLQKFEKTIYIPRADIKTQFNFGLYSDGYLCVKNFKIYGDVYNH